MVTESGAEGGMEESVRRRAAIGNVYLLNQRVAR